MARIQILELPMVDRGDDVLETPFIVIIDQASEETKAALGLMDEHLTPMEAVQRTLSVSLAQQLGARAILAFEETIDIPANETPVGPDGYPVRLRIEGDFEQFREQVQAEATAASNTLAGARHVAGQYSDGGHAAKPVSPHLRAENALARLDLCRQALIKDGYFTADEIGDDIAPRLVEWLSHHRQDIENFQGRAAAAEANIRKIKADIRDALGIDNDEVVDTLAVARDLRSQRDRWHSRLEAAGQLHHRVECGGQIICAHCSAYDLAARTTGNPAIAYPCDTVKALAGYTGETSSEPGDD